MINITYINDNGSGFLERLQVPEKTTILTFFQEKTGLVNPRSTHVVTVNGGKVGGLVTSDYVLKEGDLVSLIHANIKGERS